LYNSEVAHKASIFIKANVKLTFKSTLEFKKI